MCPEASPLLSVRSQDFPQATICRFGGVGGQVEVWKLFTEKYGKLLRHEAKVTFRAQYLLHRQCMFCRVDDGIRFSSGRHGHCLSS